MTTSNDAKLLIDHAHSVGVDFNQAAVVHREHLGSVIVDAVLQARQSYKNTVAPRVAEFERDQPASATLTGFQAFLATGELSEAIRWRGATRLDRIGLIASALAECDIETVSDMHEAFASEATGEALENRLRQIDGVARKTVNYLRILSGIDTCAIDMRLKRFASEASIEDRSVRHLEEVVAEAAREAHTTQRAIDAAMWAYGQHRSNPATGRA